MGGARFTVVGEALVDLVQDSSTGTYAAHAGGSPYNVAITLGRLGATVSLVARRGPDAFGDLLEAKARASGVVLDQWQRAAEATSLAVATLDAAGQASYGFYLDRTAALGFESEFVDVVGHAIVGSDIVGSDIVGDARPSVLHTGSIASWRSPSEHAVRELQRAAHSSGSAIVSFDPNIRPVLIDDMDIVRARIGDSVAAAHIVKVSDEDLATLYPGDDVATVAARWCASGALVVVVTRGSDGAVMFAEGGEIAAHPGLSVTVADTVGAGDSFAGGLLAALVTSGIDSPVTLASVVTDRDVLLERALVEAVTVAAMTCERPGADPPTRAELNARLRPAQG